MNEVSTMVYEFFTNNSAFTTEMSTRIYPLVAHEDTAYPFAIYSIAGPEPLTKEANRYPIVLNLFYEPANYTNAVNFHKAMETLIEDSTNWNVLETSIEFTEEDQTIIATINFEIIN